MAGRLNGEGFLVYRFDNRSHGRSDGAQSYIEDFNIYLDDADTIYELISAEDKSLKTYLKLYHVGRVEIFSVNNEASTFLKQLRGIDLSSFIAKKVYCL